MDSNTTKTIHEQAIALLEGTMSDEGWAEVLACNGQCESGPCIEMNARLRKIAGELERGDADALADRDGAAATASASTISRLEALGLVVTVEGEDAGGLAFYTVRTAKGRAVAKLLGGA